MAKGEDRRITVTNMEHYVTCWAWLIYRETRAFIHK